MNPEIDSTASGLPASIDAVAQAAAEQQQKQPVADAGSGTLDVVGEGAGAVVEAASSSAVDGILDGIFSIFE